MKKIITSILFMVLCHMGFSQYFQASFSNIGNKVTFKIRPNADITTAVGYLEFFFRYNTATTPPFTIGNIVNNTADFPGLSVTQGPGIPDPTYTYVNFVFNSGTIPSKTYTANTEYEVMSFTLDGASSVATLELASDFTIGSYYFVINAGDGTQIDASQGSGLNQFYGSGFYTSGTGQFLPLTNITLPVKFLDFSVAKKDRDALISWSVENEDENADKYIVERSVNGNDFKAVETVPALNNGSSNNTYSITQRDIASIANAGLIYYRVKQVDKGGKSVYTSTKNIRLDAKAFAVKASPNLVRTTTTLTIDLAKDSKLLVSITDANGKQIKNIQLQGFKGTNLKELNLDGLAAGNYMLKVNTGDEIKTLPIVKAN